MNGIVWKKINNTKMASLAQYSYIVALDTYRHFVTASEKCFVTQPTLSMQIKKLEEELEVVIFNRSKQPVIPTLIGEKIIAQARKILSEHDRIESIIQQEKSIIAGKLTIGIIPTLAPYLLPLFIGDFSRKYPALEIKVLELLTEEIIEQLEKNLIDVGILVTPLAEAGIVEESLFFEKMLVYTHPDHSFGNRNDIDMADIASPDIWLLSEGHCFRSQVLNLCTFQPKKETSLSFESGSIETLCKLIDREGGFTLIPELAAEEMSQQDQVKSFTNEAPLREVSLVFSRRYTKEHIIKLLQKAIQEAVPLEMLDIQRGHIVHWR